MDDIAEIWKTGKKSGPFLCPFHREKTPSFHVSGPMFHCFGCGKTGNVAELPDGPWHAAESPDKPAKVARNSVKHRVWSDAVLDGRAEKRAAALCAETGVYVLAARASIREGVKILRSEGPA